MLDTPHSAMIEAKMELALTNETLGQLVGISKRSVQRWWSDGQHPMAWHFHAVAKAVHPTNPALAARLARHGATTLEALGLVKPAVDVRAQADALVYAAAEALDVSPRTVRAAVSLVLARALEAGGDVNPLARHFAAGARGGKP